MARICVDCSSVSSFIFFNFTRLVYAHVRGFYYRSSEEKYCGHGMRQETIAFGMRILMVVPIFRNIYLIGIRISHYNDLNVSLHYSKEKCTHLFKKKNSKEEKFCSIPIYSYSIDYFY